MSGATPSGTNGWTEWGKHVLLELERNEQTHAKMMAKLDQIQEQVTMLKIKGAVWGALGGIVSAVIVALVLMGLKGHAGP